MAFTPLLTFDAETSRRLAQQVATASTPTTLQNTLMRLGPQMAALRADVKRRVAGGAITRLDRKEACDGGPFGDSENYSKETAFDPGWCFRDRERVMPPVLSVDVPCTPEGLASLFWEDVYVRCQTLLRQLLAVQPSHTSSIRDRTGAALQKQWVSDVMELVSIALEATNIQPIFLFPAQWSTSQVWTDRPGDQPQLVIPWGLYAAGFTKHGDTTRPSNHKHGANVPKQVHAFREESRRQISRATGITDDPRYKVPYGAGVHWARESSGGVPAFHLVNAPAMMFGSNIFENSQTLRAQRDGEHKPWKYRRSGTKGLPNEVLLTKRSDATTSRSAASAAIDAFAKGGARDAGVNDEARFTALFNTTAHQPAGFRRGYCKDCTKSGISTATKRQVAAAGGRPDDDNYWRDNVYYPNAQWFVQDTAAWARSITETPFMEIVSDSILFYLTNHSVYYARKYPGMTSLSTEELRDLANQIRRARGAALSVGAAMGTQLLTIVGGPLIGALIGQVAQGIQEEMQRFLSYPELPKALFRRSPSNLGCSLVEGPGGLDEAARRAQDAAGALLNRQSPRTGITPSQAFARLERESAATGPKKWLPWALGAAGIVGGALILRKMRK